MMFDHFFHAAENESLTTQDRQKSGVTFGFAVCLSRFAGERTLKSRVARGLRSVFWD
jgi:hypothetical protein